MVWLKYVLAHLYIVLSLCGTIQKSYHKACFTVIFNALTDTAYAAGSPGRNMITYFMMATYAMPYVTELS